MGIKNNEHAEMNYILQIKQDGKLLKTESRWLKRGFSVERKISFLPDHVGENQKLGFLLYEEYVKGEPYKRFYLWVSTDVNFDDLESLFS